MNQEVESYLLNARSEHLKKFEQELASVQNLTLDLWKSIIMIHGVVLGFSAGITRYLRITPNFFLKLAWVLMIISIGLGFLMFKLYIDQKTKWTLASFKFSMDMTALNLSDLKGGFKANLDKKIGMATAIFMNLESERGVPEKDKTRFTDRAKELAKKHKAELESSKIFKETEKTRLHAIKEFLVKNNSKFINAFYISSFLAFLTLLLSILT